MCPCYDVYIPADRVICATNQNLRGLVKKGTFREDLFFRINVFPIRPPPLRERRQDVLLLARHFLSSLGGTPDVQLTEGAVRLLLEYSWPGNVRELANVMERGMILAGGDAISAHTLSFLHRDTGSGNGVTGFSIPSNGISLEKMEDDLVRQALETSGNNQTAAAKLLGLSRAKFRVLLRRVDREI